MKAAYFPKIAFVIAATACLAAGPASARDCFRESFAFVFGKDVSAKMTVRNTGVCATNFKRGSGTFFENKITVPAQNGVATSIGKDSYTYRPNAGYIGTDTFVVSLTGENPVSKGTSNITVDVIVTR